MSSRSGATKEHVHYHKDGSIWAKGRTIGGVATGYWEWFRKDGTTMRSGFFENGQQAGEWTTYDAKGRVVKVTKIKPKGASTAKFTPTAKPASAPSRASRNEIDAYLAKVPDDKRNALEKLRRTIRAAAPRAEECLSYRVPAFRLEGKVLVCFAASASHCSFFPGSGTAVAAHAKELAGYDTSKGTIRFPPNRALPAALVKKIVKYRVAENAVRGKRPAATPRGGSARRKRATARS